MRKGWIALILAVAVAAGCARGGRPASRTQGKAPPELPAEQGGPLAPGPGPAEPGNTPAPRPGPTAPQQVALPALDWPQVRMLQVAWPKPGNPYAVLWTFDNEPEIRAVVAAFNAAGSGQVLEITPPVRLTVRLLLSSGDQYSLSLAKEEPMVVAVLHGQQLAIKSDGLIRELERLEPIAEKVKNGSFKAWAIDPDGKQPPELLWEKDRAMGLEALSPDGRYLLMRMDPEPGKGSWEATPVLVDRTTGKAVEARRTEMRSSVWSGSGFYIGWPAHLDLSGNEDRFPAARIAMALTDREHVVAGAFTPGGERFAALVAHWTDPPDLDLILVNSDGTGLVRYPKILTGTMTQGGVLAWLSISPDGKWLAMAGHGQEAAIVSLADPRPTSWVRFESGSWEVRWAPDSKHFVVNRDGVYDLSGKRILEAKSSSEIIWHPGGQSVLVTSVETGLRLMGLDGSSRSLSIPAASYAVGFLPDGRVVAYRAAWP